MNDILLALALLVALGLVCYGVALIYLPAAYIVGGIGLAVLAVDALDGR